MYQIFELHIKYIIIRKMVTGKFSILQICYHLSFFKLELNIQIIKMILKIRINILCYRNCTVTNSSYFEEIYFALTLSSSILSGNDTFK